MKNKILKFSIGFLILLCIGVGLWYKQKQITQNKKIEAAQAIKQASEQKQATITKLIQLSESFIGKDMHPH
jgi:hypothetical protein